MKTIILDSDDFSLENNQLFYLDKLKDQFPKLKISMFYIPWDYRYYAQILDFQREQMVEEIKKRSDWIELIPHGLSHKDREFENVKYEDMDVIFSAIHEVFEHYKLPYIKGFKAPQWLYNEDLVRYLDEKGWWLAVDRNQPNAPRTKKFYEYSHSIDEPFWDSTDDIIKLHSHISLPSANNIPDNMMNLIRMPQDAEFKFISEYMYEKNSSVV